MKNEIKDLIVNNLSLNFDQNIIIDNIIESGENILCMIRNPNMQGSIKYYDEGNWGIYAGKRTSK